jgi:predicted RNase H-like HicB family nuclease
MKTYSFKVVVETDEDFDGHPAGWHADCPVLERQGASTWGETQNEALRNINELVRMIVESMLDHGERIPEEPSDQVEDAVAPRVGNDRLTRAHRLRVHESDLGPPVQ